MAEGREDERKNPQKSKQQKKKNRLQRRRMNECVFKNRVGVGIGGWNRFEIGNLGLNESGMNCRSRKVGHDNVGGSHIRHARSGILYPSHILYIL